MRSSLPFHAIAMMFRVASDGSGHQREQDIIYAGPAGVPYGLHFCQRNFRPGELLGSAVEHVKAQALGGGREFRQQLGELFGSQAPGRDSSLRHVQCSRPCRKNSIDEI